MRLRPATTPRKRLRPCGVSGRVASGMPGPFGAAIAWRITCRRIGHILLSEIDRPPRLDRGPPPAVTPLAQRLAVGRDSRTRRTDLGEAQDRRGVVHLAERV